MTMKTPQARGPVARMYSGLACRQGGKPGTQQERTGHMWIWWDDISGVKEYRGYWPNAEGIDDRTALENPSRLSEYLRHRGVPGEIRRDRAAQVLTEHFPNRVFKRSWDIAERKLTALAYKSFIQKRSSHRQDGQYGYQISGCDNCVSWVVKCINETVGDAYTIRPFSPPNIETAAKIIFGKTCSQEQQGR